MNHVATIPFSLRLSFALNAKAPEAIITLCVPPWASGLTFALQILCSLLITPGSLPSFLLQPLIQAFAYLLAQTRQAHSVS